MDNRLLKRSIIIYLFSISSISLSQSFSTYKDSNGVTVGELNVSTGAYSPISSIIGWFSLQTTIDPVNGHFICLVQDLPSSANASLQTIELATGNVLHNINTGVGSTGIRHLEYNARDSTLYATYNDSNGASVGKLDNSTGVYTPISSIIGWASHKTTLDPINGHFICLIQDLPSSSVASLQTIELATGNVLHNINTGVLSAGIRHLEYNPCDSTLYASYNDLNGASVGKLDNSTGVYTPISSIIGWASHKTTIDAVNGHFICLFQDLPSSSVASLQTIELATGNVLHNISTGVLSTGIRDLEYMSSCPQYNNIEPNSNKELTCSEIPNIITPNNDGLNDYLQFNINGEIHLKVFNRWGNLVYSSENYKNNWDGNSEKLNEGVYYYIVTDENKTVCKSFIHVFND